MFQSIILAALLTIGALISEPTLVRVILLLLVVVVLLGGWTSQRQ